MHLHLRTEGDIPDNNKFSCAETFIHNCMHHANLIKILQKHFHSPIVSQLITVVATIQTRVNKKLLELYKQITCI